VSEDIDLRKIVADVAAAYFGNSHVTPAEIPTVINQIAASLSAVGAPAPEPAPEAPEQPKLTPAQIRKSITRDALISFEDNKPYKTLRRHLAVRGLSPQEYRAKWALPKDYPMVAPSYSEARASMARSIGLGSRVMAKTAGETAAKSAPPEPSSVPSAAPTGTREQLTSPEAAAAANPAEGGRRRAPRAAAAVAKAPKAPKMPRRGPGRPRKAKEPA
jgi:predicted transcriptional regulator